MTDNEYAVKIYCRIFRLPKAEDDLCMTGMLDALKTLSSAEQIALECRYRHGYTYKQTGIVLGDHKSDVARRIVNKAILKLKHPSRIKFIRTKDHGD